MSGSDGGRAKASSSSMLLDAFDGSISPISAADMLTRSLRRTPRRTTPTRRLFPDNIDVVAPGMTPTSRSRPKRKSTVGVKTPRKSTGRIATSSTIPPPSQTPMHDVFDEGINRSRINQAFTTPSATPGNRSVLRSDLSVTKGKRKALEDETEDSVSIVANQFGAWGSGREESPMELLRRLVRAPGRLNSPTETDDDTMQSIIQRLERSGRANLKDATSNMSRSSLKPGLIAADSSRDMGPPTSRPSISSNEGRITASRFSIANTSIAASEAGQGRRLARQSQVDNMFSDLLSQDSNQNQSIGLTTGKRSDFPLPEGIDGDMSIATSVGVRDDGGTTLEEESRDVSSTLEGALDETAPVSLKRFEDIETSIDNTRSEMFFNEEGESDVEDRRYNGGQNNEEDRNESDVFRTRNRLAHSSDGQETPQMQGKDNGDAFDFDNENDQELAPNYNDESDEVMLDESHGVTESSDDEEEEDGLIDHSKALQAARLALLRKRRTKKKAKRYSSISGNLVPCLSSSTIKGLFNSSIMPKTGLGVAQHSKGKIAVDKAATEAVEDLTHHFFAQFMQSLVSQADQKSQNSISERDILALLKSQGQISARNSLSFLARKHLPRELSDLVTSTIATSEAASARKQHRRAKAIAVAEEDSREIEEEVED